MVQQDMDTGHAWFILVACIFMYSLVGGNLKTFGVLYTEMLTYYGEKSGTTAWIGSMTAFLFFASGPVSNGLSKRFSFRGVTFIGGLFFAVGNIASSFVPSMIYLYPTYGLITGIGYGLTFSPCCTIISFYFEKRRALANGIVMASAGLGSFVLSFVYRLLFEEYGLKGALLILGGIFLNVSAAACMFTQPKQLKHVHINTHKNPVTESDNATDKMLKDADVVNDNGCFGFKLRLFKNPKFALYIVSVSLCIFSYFNNMILLPAQTQSLGFGKTRLTVAVSICGACEAVSRIVTGWFADMKIISYQQIYIISLGVTCLFDILALFFHSYEFLLAFAVVIGVFNTAFGSLLAVLVIDAVGMDDFPQGIALAFLCASFTVLIANPIAGWLEDITGNWNASFIVTAMVLFLSLFMMFLDQYFSRNSEKNSQRVQNETQDKNTDIQNATVDNLEIEENDMISSSPSYKLYRPYRTDKTKYSYDMTVPLASIENSSEV